MSDSPERIWITGYESDPTSRWWSETPLSFRCGEYVRADLALPAVQPDAQCCMCGKKGLSTEENGGPECELHDGRWVCSENCWNDALEPSAAAIREAALNEADYDAGLLNDFGGGDVNWWHDYLRAEIGRANEYWRALIDNPGKEVMPDANEAAHIQHTPRSDTAPAGLSAGGGAVYDAVREAILLVGEIRAYNRCLEILKAKQAEGRG